MRFNKIEINKLEREKADKEIVDLVVIIVDNVEAKCDYITEHLPTK